MVLTGVTLIAVQLGFRGWVVSRAWFQQDDFVFMQRALSSDLNWTYLFAGHVGHFMPAGFLLSWVNARIDPLMFALPATELWVMQAAASVSCLALLVHMFGARWGIIPPLAVFLFSPITIPAFSWWAAGVNQLPLMIAMLCGLYTHISYLRSRRMRHAIYTMLWTAFGLAFTEKTLLAFELYAIVALAYFASGHLADRVKSLWRDYRGGVLLYSAVVILFVPAYYLTYINFEAGDVAENPLGALAFNMAGVAYSSGIIGGPLDWQASNVFNGIADPSDLFLVISWAAIAGVVFVAARTRVRSKRAWLVALAVLATDILLVATGRAFLVGAMIGLEYRYQTEVVVATTVALGLAFLPLRGATETVEVTGDHPVLDSRPFWAGALILMIGLASLTTVRFIGESFRPLSPRTYFANFEGSLPGGGDTVALADRAVPDRIWPAFSFPSNLYSRMFIAYDEHLDFPKIAQDTLYMVNDRGYIRPVAIDTFRRHEPRRGSSTDGCLFRVEEGSTTVPLDGDVVGFGWWMRVGYLAERPSEITIEVGDEEYTTRTERGAHALYFSADGEYDSITITGGDGAEMCIDDVRLGIPVPAGGQ